MKKSRFTESQIVAILEEGDAGLPIAQLAWKRGISGATYFTWRSKYAGLSIPQLKRMCAGLALENVAIKDVLSRRL